MREAAAFAFVYLWFSIEHFSSSSRSSRVASFGCLGLAVAVLWPSGASYAWLFTLTSGCVVATLVVLLAPLQPRLTRGIAVASGLLAVLFWLGAAIHG